MPSIEPMLMTRAGSSAVPAAARRGTRNRVRWNTPFTLRSRTRSQAASSNSAIGAPQVAPALLTRTSRRSSRAARSSARPRAPASAKPRAIISPMPRLPPVTSAVFPSIENRSWVGTGRTLEAPGVAAEHADGGEAEGGVHRLGGVARLGADEDGAGAPPAGVVHGVGDEGGGDARPVGRAVLLGRLLLVVPPGEAGDDRPVGGRLHGTDVDGAGVGPQGAGEEELELGLALVALEQEA